MSVIETEARQLGVKVSEWRPRERYRESSLRDSPAGEFVRWIDITQSSAKPDELLGRLAPSCPGLDGEMLADVLSPETNPGGQSYAAAGLRLTATFSIEARSVEGAEGRDDFEGPGLILFQPVDLLAGDGWLLTCWHPRTVYRGIQRVGEEPPEDKAALIAAVAERWLVGKGQSSGDLGVQIMHELALTYAPTHRKIYDWLEQWELGLYVNHKADREPIGQLWGSVTLFRKWLAPLNPAGLRTDINKAWLIGATDHEECLAVDTRIDKALSSLRALGDSIRASFNMLHHQLEDDSRNRREENQRRLEVLAAAFLVPTLIVGFFGANTWLPGDRHPPGSVPAFVIMIAALVILTVGAVSFLIMTRRRQRADEQRLAEEREQLRRAMGFSVYE